MWLAFLCSWGAMIGILAGAGKDGANVNKVFHGTEFSNGYICGTDPAVKDYPYTAFPAPTFPYVQICVKDCNVTQSPDGNPSAWNPQTGGGWTTQSGININPLIPIIPYKSIAFLNSFCLPDITAKINVAGQELSLLDALQNNDAFSSSSAEASRVMADLMTAWVLILISGFVAFVLSFFWLGVLKYCAGPLVWSVLIFLIVGGALTAFGLIQSARDIQNSEINTYRAKPLLGLGIAAAGLTFIFTCLVIFLRKRIEIAIQVVIESADALRDMGWLQIFPAIPFLLLLGYMAFWITSVVFIFSVADKTTRSDWPDAVKNAVGSNQPDKNGVIGYRWFEFKEDYKKAMAYVFFHLLWSIQIVIYFVYMVTACAVAQWYFTPYGPDQKKIRGEPSQESPSVLPDNAVMAAVKRVLRFHLGTVFVAALIVAIIDFIRAVVKYIEEKSKPKEGPPNKLQECMFCSIQCCLYCIRCCCDKINKNALIWCAVYGSPFLPSACSSFALLWRNLGRVVAINGVSTFLLFVGRIMVAAATTGFAVIVMLKWDSLKVNLNSPVMPAVIIFLLAFGVVTLFMMVFETVIDTVFLCFLIDEEHNKAAGKMTCSAGFKKLIDDYSDKSERLAKNIKGEHKAAPANSNNNLSSPLVS